MAQVMGWARPEDYEQVNPVKDTFGNTTGWNRQLPLEQMRSIESLLQEIASVSVQ
jgi:hypothetical protein